MRASKKGKMLLYAVGLTGSQLAWFDSCSRGAPVEARHYEGAHAFEAALEGEKPGIVVIADPPWSEKEIRRILDAHEETKGTSVIRAARSAPDLYSDDDDPKGSAQAVMTGFDQMSPIDDTDPWRKQPI
jgi:hypothetical protein